MPTIENPSDNYNYNVATEETRGEFWFAVEEKPYVCTTSMKQFPLESQLQCCQGIDEGEKPLKHDVQNKQFKQGDAVRDLKKTG